MTAKRLLVTVALGILAVSAGCRSWCEHHYPQTQQGCCAPCQPCAPAMSAGYSAAPPPPVWNNPGPKTCTCTLQ